MWKEVERTVAEIRIYNVARADVLSLVYSQGLMVGMQGFVIPV